MKSNVIARVSEASTSLRGMSVANDEANQKKRKANAKSGLLHPCWFATTLYQVIIKLNMFSNVMFAIVQCLR
ncbi:MAG: hypothetical protein LBH30_04255 [Prevotellaceae bacterium]|nr:hypothetical protein [Prevotellaceae bacterium]